VTFEDRDKIADSISNSNLYMLYKKSVAKGDIPFKRNRRVLRLFDIDEDSIKGEREARQMLREIDVWIKTLEDINNASNRVSRDIRTVS
jgi:hypothetical protein